MAQPLDLLKDDISSTLARMTLPMMFGMVSLMLFNLADLYFVSRLGTEPLAAFGFTFPVSFSVISLAIGLGIGTSATLAKLLGAGQRQQASALASDNLLMVAVVVLLLTLVFQWSMSLIFVLMGASDSLLPLALDYMNIWLIGSVFLVVNMVSNACFRASGDTKTPALMMAGSSLLNFILDPLLIFGFGPIEGLGIEGAAWASCLAWGITTLAALYILFYKKRLLIVQAFDLKRVFRNFAQVMKIGLPAALSNMMTPLAQALLTFIVAQQGAEAVAAFGVGNRIESLSLLVCLALSMTLPPFVSQNFGAGDIQRVKQAYRQAAIFALIWQLLVYVAMFVVMDSVAAFFSDSAEVIELIVLWLLIVPLGFGFQALTFLTASCFNALHQPMQAMLISVMRLFVFSLPLAWLSASLWGLQGMFVSLVVANMLVSALSFFKMQTFLHKLQ